MINFYNLFSQIKKSDNISIIFHINPDYDALCSSLGFKLFLDFFFEKINIISPSLIPDYLKNLNEINSIIEFERDENLSINILENSDVIFFLDLSSKKRLGNIMENLLPNLKAKKIVIDHHKNPEKNFYDFIVHFENHSSTCEIIYDIINFFGFEKYMNSKIAENLYKGIASDTGFFTFSNSTLEVFQKISNLIYYGINPNKIYNEMINSKSSNIIKFLGFSLYEKLMFFFEEKLAIIILDSKDIEKFQINFNETDIIFSSILSIKNIEVVILCKEKKDYEYSLSFRSKNIKIENIAKNYFQGGGHDLACGGIFCGEKENLLSLLKDIFEKIL